MNTTVSTHTRNYRVNANKIRKITDVVCRRLGVGGTELSVSLVGNQRIRKLNQQFRGKDRPTDVLSFPQHEWTSPAKLESGARTAPRSPKIPLLGDVVISLPIAERNANHIGQNLDREVCFLIVHGILHLCGHDHMTAPDEKRMLKIQRSLMDTLTKQAGGPLWKSIVTKRRNR